MSKYFVKDIPLEIDEIKNGKEKFHIQSIGDVITNLLRNQKEHEHEGSSIALIGSWGTGKSTLLKYIESELKDSHKFIFVNAWPYDEESLKSVLLREVFYEISNENRAEKKEFYNTLRMITASETDENKTVCEKMKELFRIIIPLITVSLIFCGILLLLMSLSGSISISDILANYFMIFFITIFIGNGGIWAFFSYIKERKSTNIHVSLPLETADYYEHKLTEYIDKSNSRGNKKRFVVIIDDLDRLSFESMIQSIETVKVFMDIPRLDVILPFDERIVKSALKETKLKKLYMQEYNLAKYEGFLDKLFQYKFYMPPIKSGHIKNFALNLLTSLEGIEAFHQKYGVDSADIISIMIYSKVETPRQVKKLINAYSANLQITVNRVETKDLQMKLGADEFKIIAFLSTLHSEFGYFYDALVDGDISLNSNGELKKYIEESEGKLNAYVKFSEKNSQPVEITLNEKGNILDNYLSYNTSLNLEIVNEFLFVTDSIIVKKYGLKAEELKEAYINKNIKAEIIDEYVKNHEFINVQYDLFLADIIDATKGVGDYKAVNNIKFTALMLFNQLEIGKEGKAYERIRNSINLSLLSDYEISILDEKIIDYFYESEKKNIYLQIEKSRYNQFDGEKNKKDRKGYEDKINRYVEIHKNLLEIGISEQTEQLIEGYREIDNEEKESVLEETSIILYRIMSKSEYIEMCNFDEFDECVVENTKDITEIGEKLKLYIKASYLISAHVIETIINNLIKMKTDEEKELILLLLENVSGESILHVNEYIRTFNSIFSYLSSVKENKRIIFEKYGKCDLKLVEDTFENPGRNNVDFRQNILNIMMNGSFLRDNDAIEFVKCIMTNNEEVAQFNEYIAQVFIDKKEDENSIEVLKWINDEVFEISELLKTITVEVSKYFVYSSATAGKFVEYMYIIQLLEELELINIMNLVTNQSNFNTYYNRAEYAKTCEMIKLSALFVQGEEYKQLITFWNKNTNIIISGSNTDAYKELLKFRFEVNDIDEILINSFSSKINLYYQNKELVSKVLNTLINDEQSRRAEIISVLKFIFTNETESREVFSEIYKHENINSLLSGLSDNELETGLNSISTEKVNRISKELVKQYSSEKLYDYILLTNRNSLLVTKELIKILFSDTVDEYIREGDDVDYSKLYIFFAIAQKHDCVTEEIKNEKIWDVLSERLSVEDYKNVVLMISLVKVARLEKNRKLRSKIKSTILLKTENDEIKNAITKDLRIRS